MKVTPPASTPAPTIQDRIRRVGGELGRTLADVLAALPGAPHRPNQLVAELGVNRAVASRVLNATSKRDPLELMHLVPGPEPLRRLVRSAQERGVSDALAGEAVRAIHEFDQLIREGAGTRSALDALISSSLPGARERFELSSKYSVYKGLSQLKGVRAELWVGAAVVAPSPDDPEKHDLTWLNGAVAMQRLRPGVTARFSYRYHGGERTSGGRGDSPAELSVVPLEQFCQNPSAHLEARRAGKAVHYTLPDDILGPQEVVDMFVVDHHPAAMNRTSTPAPRKRNSLFVEPAIPVGTLLFDVILHDEAFPGSEPELYLYDTSYEGIANVNDPARDIDRADVQESVEFLGHDLARFEAAELTSYGPMLRHLAGRFGWDPARFRGYRTRIQYPVYGWQVCLSFDPLLGG